MKHPSFRTFVTALLLAGVTTANATPQTTG